MASSSEASASSGDINQPPIVVIGAGYSAISCCEELRKLGDTSPIILYTQEPHCSRPTILFRLKFLAKDSIGSSSFLRDGQLDKWKLEIRSEKITSINRVTKCVVSGSGQTQSYARLIIATGSYPHIISYPVQSYNNELELSPESGQKVPSSMLESGKDSFTAHVSEAMQSSSNPLPLGVFVVRNMEETAHLHELVMNGARVAICGGGTLALDLASNLTEGFHSVAATHSHLHPIALIARRPVVGSALLGEGENDASHLLTQRVTTAEKNYLQLIAPEEIECLLVQNGRLSALKFASGRVLPCDALVQAVGVRPNVSLASAAGLTIGSLGGVLVNEKYQSVDDSAIYSIGDCAEIIDSFAAMTSAPSTRAIWRNWTAAREQGIACAQHIHSSPSVEQVLFHQTTKLFGLQCACLGYYLPPSSVIESGSVKVLCRKSEERVVKLVFSNENMLIGALICGPTTADFSLGMSVWKIIRMMRRLPEGTAERMICSETPFDWTAEWKRLRGEVEEEKKLAEAMKQKAVIAE